MWDLRCMYEEGTGKELAYAGAYFMGKVCMMTRWLGSEILIPYALVALSMSEGKKSVVMAIIAFNPRIRRQLIVMRRATANEGDSERHMLSMRSF